MSSSCFGTRTSYILAIGKKIVRVGFNLANSVLCDLKSGPLC